ncbi:aminotransferase [Microcella alkaliphila]|uniref:4-aminobutyrate aminotransferase n=1 Tax=Microcella alkaliphila TaxID=279828 RepID=A0A0U5BCJ4_9MICO|nr:aminotransferase [Microcella alkaliphila]BAU33449.1 4-aminobutyrate aminotransferase [Microcella alkaliphila]
MSDTLFDYFSQVELPTPTLGPDEVTRLFAQHFGLDVDLQPLGSQQDQNFRVFPRGESTPLGVLKLSNPAFSEAEITMQDAAAAQVAERQPALRIPKLVEGPRGAMSAWWESSEGRIHARVIENIAGSTLTGSAYLGPDVVARMGELSGRVSVALADYRHPASGRVLQWDLRHAERVIDTLLPREPDEEVRATLAAATDPALAALAPVAEHLPVQAGHFDITDDNILRPVGGRLPDAVIDFGDVAASWAVGELATTLSSLLHHDGATPATTLPAIRAFHALRPLTGHEVDALWALVTLRGVVLVLSGREQVRLDASNDYASGALDREYRVFEVASSVPPTVMAAVIRRALGMPVTAPDAAGWQGAAILSPSFRAPSAIDAGTVSSLNDVGAWMHASVLENAAAAALAAGADVAYVPAWQPILTGAPARTPDEPATVPTGVTVWLAEPAVLTGDVTVEGESLVVHGDGEALVLSGEGVAAGLAATDAASATDAGASATHATLPAHTRILIQRRPQGAPPAPAMVTASLAPGWRAVLGDPAGALGLAADLTPHDDTVDPTADSHAVLARRERVLAEVQEHYYSAPPQIERGWREYLVDTDGRVYLDMLNNVTSVGHAHPQVVEAAHRQMRLLNTNSRFHYAAITEYAERIAAKLPEHLDTVFFVNSGSEAVDLAIRLAMAATGRPDIVAMREAYHGWTFASDAVSTSIADNPNALETRPEWVHTVDAANAYRGTHRGADAHRYAPEAVAVIDALAESGRPPAGFICEPYFGNAGGVPLPDGYLEQVYAAVRRHGGVVIADEVQVGYGRLGGWFWGHEQQGVVPDIVAVAKSVGSGHPVGAVITTREIADKYRTGGYFFASTGGSPVSSVIGMAVLDVIENEGLQQNAWRVGQHLRRRLEALMEQHPIIGAVHGSGLYMGLELVRDRSTLEPATEETALICDRLRELGVIMQPTGDYQNVFKIKPPLCVTIESADYFADQVERVLATGW